MAEKGVMLADRPAMRAPPASSYGGYSSNAPQLTAYGAGVESSTSASLSAAASVGNYKGVMLCNRPDPSGGMGNTASGGSTPFSVPGHHEQVHPRGQNPGLLERLSKLPPGRMSAAASSVEKTKEFLRELAAKKEELLRQKAEEEARIEERRQRLAEQSRLLRELIRNNVDENATLDQHADGGARPPLAENRQAGNSAYSHADVASRTAKQNSKAENKPAWARSAAAVEADEDDEADKLLDFADNLDFGNYEADLEDKAGETLLQRRLREVEAAEVDGQGRLAAAQAMIDEEQEKDARRKEMERRRRRAKRRARKAAAAAAGKGAGEVEEKKGEAGDGDHDDSASDDDGEDSGSGTDTDGAGYSSAAAANNRTGRRSGTHRGGSGYGSGGGGRSDDDVDDDGDSIGPLPGRHRAGRGGDDAGSVATSILSSASTVRGVHSKKSLTAVVERTQRDERERIAAAVADNQSMPVYGLVPVIVTHNDLGPAIEAKKHLVANLPYQHRNPAV